MKKPKYIPPYKREQRREQQLSEQVGGTGCHCDWPTYYGLKKPGTDLAAIHETLKDDWKKCEDYTRIKCEGSCPFTRNGDKYERLVTYDESVTNGTRYNICRNSFHVVPTVKVGVLVLNSTGSKVLLVRSYNNKWGLPKGNLDKSDIDPVMGALRELKEETGIVIHDKSRLQEIMNRKLTKHNEIVYKLILREDEFPVDMIDNLDIEVTSIGWFDKVNWQREDMNAFGKKCMRDWSQNKLDIPGGRAGSGGRAGMSWRI